MRFYRAFKVLIKLALVSFLFLSILMIGRFIYNGILSYYGYCYKDMSQLSTEQRLNRAINKYLKMQKDLGLSVIGRNESNSLTRKKWEKIHQNYEVIEYTTREDFLSENPDCCNLTWVLPEGERIDFERKFYGSGDGYFYFKHKIRYRDRRTGEQKETISIQTFYQINNCGGVTQHVYDARESELHVIDRISSSKGDMQ